MLNEIPDSEIQEFSGIAGNDLVCTTRKTPTVLYGIFTELLQQFWGTAPGERIFGTPDVQWDKNPSKTTIWVDSELRWEATHPEFRPAIYVKLSPIQHGTVSGGTSPLILTDVQEAVRHYARTGQGTVSFVHVGSTSGEACSLADATMDYLDAFSPVIVDDFCFDWFNLVSRTPVQQADKDSKEKYASVVTYEYRFTDNWTIKQEAPKLKSFVVKATDSVTRRIEVGEYWSYQPDNTGRPR